MFLNTDVAYCWHLQENVNTYCRPIMILSKTSPVTFYIYASNSLIIHKENTKEINVQWVFGNQSLISPSKIILFEKWYQAFPGVQFNSLPMDDLTAGL